VEFRLLGPLEASEHGRVLDLGAGKQRALFAILLLHANEIVSTTRLIDDLWPEAAPRTVAKSIQVYVSGLRKELGDGRLETRKPGYLLRVDPAELDVARFERLLAEAEGDPPERAGARLREALALWRGAPLADFADERFARPEIARLEGLRLAAFEQRIDADLATGRDVELVGELRALVAEHPLRERPRAQLMVALYRSGRQAEALDVYRDARRALIDELGIEPGAELRALEQAILEHDPALDGPRPAPAARAGGATLVGRERELSELRAALEDALSGHGRLVLLTGEPGIGKTRLTEELTLYAARRGARVLVGRCWEAGGAPAYWPWVQSLRAYMRDSEPDALRSAVGDRAGDLAQLVPELRRHVPGLPEQTALEPDAARFVLFDATAEFLRNASHERPLVVVLDDLHAADEPSLLLLRFLARELPAARILVLGACRDVDPLPGTPLTELLADVAREPAARRISLRGLSARELSDYVEQTAPQIASAPLVAMLHEETEGNPLFAGEIVRLLAVEGIPAAGAAIAVPQGVRDVIARRLTHLSDGCNRLLALASILGREFALDALALLAGAGEDELLELLDEAMAARVVSDIPGAAGRLRFAHVLIRDALYEELTSVRRVALHRRAVAALERLYGGEPGPLLAELAHHALAGDDAGSGLHYARRAGEYALALLAYEEAVRLFRLALDALALADADDAATRCELLLALGDAASRAGDAGVYKAAFAEAAGIARRLGLARPLARAAVEYGGRIIYGRARDDERLLPLLEEGLAAVPADDVELRVGLLARLAGALRDERSSARRDALSRDAIELARRSGDLAALAYALDGRAIAIAAPETQEEIIAAGRELCLVGERIGDRERVLHGHLHQLGPLLTLGRLADARASLATASRIADDLRQPAHLWDVRGAQTMLALAAGALDDAEALMEEARVMGERVQPEIAIPVHRAHWCTLCELRGTLAEVEPAIRQLVAARPARPVFRCLLAHVHARLGRLAEAAPALAELSRDGTAALPRDQEWMFATSLLAETAGVLGDHRAAAILYDLLLPWGELNAVDQCEGTRGSVARYLGIAASTTRRWDEADRHFTDAAAMNERMDAAAWRARTEQDHARMLLARGADGDEERARSLLERAHATCRELGIAAG
jgi:eukaryotic-like serine/threonine-protein kinase